MKNINTLILLLSISFLACNNTETPKEDSEKTEQRSKIEMLTDKGIMIIELYNETPKHRDNFIKLANEGAYDSLLFHRVIENFMIQAGDPDSKNAQVGDILGNGDRDYRVDAEFVPHLFHKKGVLAAARDGNIEKASSAMQFYLVQGIVYNDSTLLIAEERLNGWIAENEAKKDTANKELVKLLDQAMVDMDMKLYMFYSDSLKKMAEGKFEKYIIPNEQREVYKTIGGTPHLDQNYTVFGEVIEGLEIIDIIAAVPTGKQDRPVNDVKIISAKVLK